MNAEKVSPPAWVRIALAVGALLSFGATFWLAYWDKAAAATVMAGLTAALLAFAFLPLFETFEAFGLKAQLRRQIGEADTLLTDLRAITLVISKQLYLQLAWGGRWGAPSIEDRAKWVEELDRTLAKLQVDDAERRRLQAPFINFVAYDLFVTFEKLVRERLHEEIRANKKEIDSKFERPVDGSDPEAERLMAVGRKLTGHLDGIEDLHTSPLVEHLDEVVKLRVSALPIPDGDKAILSDYGRRLAALGAEVQKSGRITEAALVELKRHRSDSMAWREDYREIFGR